MRIMKAFNLTNVQDTDLTSKFVNGNVHHIYTSINRTESHVIPAVEYTATEHRRTQSKWEIF